MVCPRVARAIACLLLAVHGLLAAWHGAAMVGGGKAATRALAIGTTIGIAGQPIVICTVHGLLSVEDVAGGALPVDPGDQTDGTALCPICVAMSAHMGLAAPHVAMAWPTPRLLVRLGWNTGRRSLARTFLRPCQRGPPMLA